MDIRTNTAFPVSANPQWDTWLGQWFKWLVIIGIVVNASGLFITILDSDGTLYATIAKTIAISGDFVNLKVGGEDWLDKPHLPFWMAAISFKLFGINTIAYKLPAFFCWAMGGVYTYLFARKAYNAGIARLSVLFYLTAAHLVISNNDVRAEPYLTGFIIGSVYHFYIASGQQKITWHIVAGSLLAALAVMTKGPFVVICIAAGFIVEWALKKQWRQFVHYKWYAAILLTGVFTFPELYCLYVQFDMHPEKVVFGQTNVSGLKFFFWDSQFGRFFNNGPIKGSGDPFFYLHTILWALLPWSVLFYLSLYSKVVKRSPLFRREYITVGTSIVMLLIFSLSKFQLPHYLNILFPFFCILIAQYLYPLTGVKTINVLRIVQYCIAGLLVLVMGVLIYFYRPENFIASVVFALLVVAVVVFVFRKRSFPNVLGKTFVAASGIYLFVNLFFYPSLLKFQSGSNAARYSNQNDKNVSHAAVFDGISHSFHFYTNKNIVYGNLRKLKQYAVQYPLAIYTTKAGLDSLRHAGFSIDDTKSFPFFHASRLTGKFINHATRAKAVQTRYLVEVTYPGIAGNSSHVADFDK
ncbi:MAG: ArnT family glycosyltransferase [Agriterribacter sp.]